MLLAIATLSQQGKSIMSEATASEHSKAAAFDVWQLCGPLSLTEEVAYILSPGMCPVSSDNCGKNGKVSGRIGRKKPDQINFIYLRVVAAFWGNFHVC